MQKVVSHVELNFWNWYILLLSQSPVLRKLVPFFYRVTRKQLLHFYLLAVAVAAAGFLSGILLFSLLGH